MTIYEFADDLNDAQTKLWQAVGVLMQRHDVDQRSALALLLDQSRTHKGTVIDFARALVDEASSRRDAMPTTEAP